MKRLFLTLLLMVCVLVPAFAKDSGTRFSSISGTVEVAADADAKAETWKFGKMDSVLNVDDHVKTGEESGAILSFADMSTFVMKEETHIVLNSPPDKDSKIQIVAGKVWANVKKMVKDGSMEIDMSQAVAGIKGTNITCSTRPDGSEDRIQVLRGRAEVLIKANQQRIMVEEGEELTVKPGGKTDKTEVDVDKVKDEWKDAVSKMGSNIQLNEIPETTENIKQTSAEAFKEIQDEYKGLMANTENAIEDVDEFKKEAERYIGVLMEGGVLLATMQGKVNAEMSREGLTPDERAQLLGYQKDLADTVVALQGYSTEIGKMLKSNFLTSSAGAIASELEMVQNDVAEIWSVVDSILQEVQANPTGISQDWFMESLDLCNEALNLLGESMAEAQELLDQSPQDAAAQALVKQISDYQTQIGSIMKDLAVVEIDGAVITEMADAEEMMSEAITTLSDQIDSYNDAVAGQADEVKLERSLGILNNFSKARRLYQSSQRLYDSIMRSTSGQKFKTAEQEELESTYDRITETYQQLGITAEELQSRLSELESQLGTKLQ